MVGNDAHDDHDLGERVSAIETSVTSIDRAVTRLEDKFDLFVDKLAELFVSRKENEETKRSVEGRLGAVESELRDLRRSRGRLPPWGQAALATLVTVVGAFIGHSVW